MEPLMLVILMSAITFIGWNILYPISARLRNICFLEGLALSYGLGIGMVSLEILLFSFLRIEFNPVRVLAPWALLVIINVAVHFCGRKPLPPQNAPMPEEPRINRPLAAFLIAGITFETIYAFFRTLIKPIESYDAIAIYGIKAKIFYLAKSIPDDFFTKVANIFPHPDYPLNIPLIESFVYIFLGNMNDQLVKAIFPMFFLGILALLYFAVKRFANSRLYALLSVFILATIPQFSAYAANAYLDLVFAYYYFASAIFLFRWTEDGDTHSLLISAVMIALAAWTKNEGLLYCAVNMAIIGIYLVFGRKRVKAKDLMQVSAYLFITVFISLPWFWVKREYGFSNSDVGAMSPLNLFSQLHKIGPIIYEFQKQILGPKKWNILWPLALFALAVNYKKAFTVLARYVTLSIALAVGGYVYVYITGNVEINYFLGRTWSRFLIHFLPVVVYWLCLMFREDVKL